MNTLPVLDTPTQTFNCTLNGQFVTLNIRTNFGGLFMDVYVNNALIIGGVICENLNPIIRNTYLGFSGDLLWKDTQGSSDPSTPGLGTRYLLFYASPDDIGTTTA